MNTTDEETTTLTDAADRALENHALLLAAGDTLTTVESGEEAPEMYECRYCGHYPCGCGG